jgi:antitoxin CptB
MTAEIHEHRIKRLKMRSMRRGIKEMDLILPPFADRHLPDMDDADLTLYEQMLNESDHDLYQWVTGQAAPPEIYARFVALIQSGLAPKSV